MSFVNSILIISKENMSNTSQKQHLSVGSVNSASLWGVIFTPVSGALFPRTLLALISLLSCQLTQLSLLCTGAHTLVFLLLWSQLALSPLVIFLFHEEVLKSC